MSSILQEGDIEYKNDLISLSIAMDIGSVSELTIFSYNGKGIINYNTLSDYIYKVERLKSISELNVNLQSGKSDMLGYPEYFSWIPGNNISLLSQNSNIENSINVETVKNSLSDQEYHKDKFIILEDFYQQDWSPEGVWEIVKLAPEFEDQVRLPFFESQTKGEGTEGRKINLINWMVSQGLITESSQDQIDLVSELGSFKFYSSSVNGSIFKLILKRNFFYSDAKYKYLTSFVDELGLIKTNGVGPFSTITEWNNIFDITFNSNVYSKISISQSRDEVFYAEIEEYINTNWDNKLKDNLWGQAIEDNSLDLSSRDPSTLRQVILYCLKYFGASQDIYLMGSKFYPDLSDSNVKTLIQWKMHTGAIDNYSGLKRKIIREDAFIPMLNKTINVPKIVFLPPKTSYAYSMDYNKLTNTENNTGYN